MRPLRLGLSLFAGECLMPGCSLASLAVHRTSPFGSECLDTRTRRCVHASPSFDRFAPQSPDWTSSSPGYRLRFCILTDCALWSRSLPARSCLSSTVLGACSESRRAKTSLLPGPEPPTVRLPDACRDDLHSKIVQATRGLHLDMGSRLAITVAMPNFRGGGICSPGAVRPPHAHWPPRPKFRRVPGTCQASCTRELCRWPFLVQEMQQAVEHVGCGMLLSCPVDEDPGPTPSDGGWRAAQDDVHLSSRSRESGLRSFGGSFGRFVSLLILLREGRPAGSHCCAETRAASGSRQLRCLRRLWAPPGAGSQSPPPQRVHAGNPDAQPLCRAGRPSGSLTNATGAFALHPPGNRAAFARLDGQRVQAPPPRGAGGLGLCRDHSTCSLRR